MSFICMRNRLAASRREDQCTNLTARTIGSTESTAVSRLQFCAIFTFFQVEWRHNKVEVTLFMPLGRVFIPVSNGTKITQIDQKPRYL